MKELQRERERERCRAFAVPTLPVFSLLSISPSNPFIIFLLILRDRILSSFPFSIKKRSIIVRVTENVPPEIRSDVRSDTSTSFRSNLMINSLPNSLYSAHSVDYFGNIWRVFSTRETNSKKMIPFSYSRRSNRSCIVVSGRGEKGMDRQPELYTLPRVYYKFIKALSWM